VEKKRITHSSPLELLESEFGIDRSDRKSTTTSRQKWLLQMAAPKCLHQKKEPRFDVITGLCVSRLNEQKVVKNVAANAL
jgi:hypothetical protein